MLMIYDRATNLRTTSKPALVWGLRSGVAVVVVLRQCARRSDPVLTVLLLVLATFGTGRPPGGGGQAGGGPISETCRPARACCSAHDQRADAAEYHF